jgi:hypothetical protein
VEVEDDTTVEVAPVVETTQDIKNQEAADPEASVETTKQETVVVEPVVAVA